MVRGSRSAPIGGPTPHERTAQRYVLVAAAISTVAFAAVDAAWALLPWSGQVVLGFTAFRSLRSSDVERGADNARASAALAAVTALAHAPTAAARPQATAVAVILAGLLPGTLYVLAYREARTARATRTEVWRIAHAADNADADVADQEAILLEIARQRRHAEDDLAYVDEIVDEDETGGPRLGW